MVKKLKALANLFPKQVGDALHRQAQLVMTDSKRSYVPVKLGTLRGSGHVALPTVTAKEISVALGFGDASAPYALDQHENLTYKHRVGEAKYLEKPLKKRAKGMSVAIAKDLKF